MNENATKTQILLARLAGLLVVALIIAGVVWHGVSAVAFQRLWQNIVDRPGGPMKFRFILQPCMATIAALHDGLKDARMGRSPYLWTVPLQSCRAGQPPARGTELDWPDHPARGRDGHDLPGDRVRYVLSGRNGDRRSFAGRRPLSDLARTDFALRALAARRCPGKRVPVTTKARTRLERRACAGTSIVA